MTKLNHSTATNTGVPAGKQKPENSKIQVERYLKSKYDVRYNVVLGKAEYKLKTEVNYLPVSDYVINSLEREMLNADIPCNVSLLEKTLRSDYSPIFNPFETYFEGLPEWDGKTDHILALAQTVTTTDDTLWIYCFKKWLVALVGCALSDTVINHTVIVFSGKQGVGKTTWLLNLLPDEIKQYCYSGTIDPKNKDTTIHLSETILINMDELESLNRAQLGSLKEIITKSTIRLRRSYGRNNENMPRRASFAGSVNGKDFLSDTTGNRRFLCFEVTSIDYKNTVALSAVYAQALQLFRAGFQFWFDKTEIDRINLNNEQYRNTSIEEELLTAHFTQCVAHDADHFFTTTELLTWLTQKAKLALTDSAKQKMGKALKAHSYLRLKRQNRHVYALKEIVLIPEQVPQLLSTQKLLNGLFG
jgi:predicted P-loop ATPase